MAKIVGIQRGVPVQAAAGLQDDVLTPIGLVLLTSALVGGWAIGHAAGSAWREHGDILAVEPAAGRRSLTDGEEWISFVAASAGCVLSVDVLKKMVEEYGAEKLALYGIGLTAFVVIGRAVRG